MATTKTSTKPKTKLSVRNPNVFKKSSCSSSVSRRGETISKKAYELSVLCDVDVCFICYGRDGELTTWPEDKAKVRNIAERFSKLSDGERRKKSTNLSEFLKKKIKYEKKRSLENKDNRFSEKVLEMEDSLKRSLTTLQDKFRFLLSNKQIEPDQSQRLAVSSECGELRTEQDQSLEVSSSCTMDQPLNRLSGVSSINQDQIPTFYSGFNTDLSTPLMECHHQQQWTEPLMDMSSTEQDQSRDMSSLNHHQSKFSFFLYNHDNGTFTQLAGSALRFQQPATPYNDLGTDCDYSALLLGAQRFGGDGAGLRRNCNNIDLPMVIPTQNPFDQFAAWT